MGHSINRLAAFVLALLITLFGLDVHAQNQMIADSLKIVLNASSQIDSNYLFLLKYLATYETDPVEAEVYADELIDKARDLNHPHLEYDGYLQKGNADRLQGNLEEALASLFKGSEIANELKDASRIAGAYAVIADAYSVSGNQSNAEMYYEKSISALRQTKDSVALAVALLNAGDEYYNTGAYERAVRNFKESAAIFKKMGHTVGQGYNLGNLGMVYASIGESELAEIYMSDAIRVLEQSGDFYPIAVYLTYMSDIYIDKAEVEKALKYASRSLQLAEEYELKDQISQAHLKLSQIHEVRDDHEKSLHHYKQHVNFRDSVSDIETVEEMANIRTEFEVSQKQLEVDLLNQKRRNQRIVVYATLFALLLIGILAIVLYRRFVFTKKTNKIIESERSRSENLLLNILPAETAQELKDKGSVQAKRFESVTVLFTDFKGFTKYAEHLPPEELVKSVDYYFSKFDEIIGKHGLEKIKTVGDAYMCAGGLPDPSEDHAVRIVRAAIDIANFVDESKHADIETTSFDIRIGINTGPVVAGVVGTKKFAYDIWGDAVNVASRMESNSEPGKINISHQTYELVKDHFECTYRGEGEVKNRGRMKMYFVVSEKKMQTAEA